MRRNLKKTKRREGGKRECEQGKVGSKKVKNCVCVCVRACRSICVKRNKRGDRQNTDRFSG